MAFGGVPVVEYVSDNMFRVTGVTLAAAANGTISLNVGAGAVKGPAQCIWEPPVGPAGLAVSLIAAIEVSVQFNGAGANNPVVQVSKAGATAALFLATIQNNDAANATPTMEIYVRYRT